MIRRRLSWAALGFGVILSAASMAHAQAQPGDPASRPALSPWFGLYQKNGGPLDNYHMFVRPRFQLNNTLRQQQDAIQSNNAGIRSLDQEMTSTQERMGIRPTGSASVFMNYSHYYPGPGQSLGNQSVNLGGNHRRAAVSRSTSAARGMQSLKSR
ncbi:MAG: hypothetical protein LLG00_11770 [Planctomycetaceae bacterium]|nr:hypothetical protein [Planctomycetaceae bacterium]